MEPDNKISLQPFNHTRDRALLEKWINSPHIMEWWGDPDKIKEEIAAGLNGLPDSVIDIDIAIGEISYLGQGVAPQALQLLINRLFTSENAPMVMICTSIDNIKAIRAFEKAGFRKDRIFADPGYGNMWLFTIEA